MDAMGDAMTGTAAAGHFRGCWSFGEAAASPTKRVECPLGSNSVHLTEDAAAVPQKPATPAVLFNGYQAQNEGTRKLLD